MYRRLKTVYYIAFRLIDPPKTTHCTFKLSLSYCVATPCNSSFEKQNNRQNVLLFLAVAAGYKKNLNIYMDERAFRWTGGGGSGPRVRP